MAWDYYQPVSIAGSCLHNNAAKTAAQAPSTRLSARTLVTGAAPVGVLLVVAVLVVPVEALLLGVLLLVVRVPVGLLADEDEEVGAEAVEELVPMGALLALLLEELVAPLADDGGLDNVEVLEVIGDDVGRGETGIVSVPGPTNLSAP